jgi:hypothetical protein
MGHQVGSVACGLLPNGVMVEPLPDLKAALNATRALLNEGHRDPIFEATFEHDGVLVRIDVLEPDGTDCWKLAEVKSSSKVKDYHIGDVATQLWVARNAGLNICAAAIRHIDTSFILQRDGDYVGLFADTDLIEKADLVAERRPELIQAARRTLTGAEPLIEPSDHCNTPFSCEFSAYCNRNSPPGPEWPVTVLPHGGGKKWLAQGITDVHDIDPTALTNPVQRRVFDATVSGVPYHNDNSARQTVSGWAYPRAWLDFETIAFAVPRWIGTRPYQQVPFQFSAHVEHADGETEHYEFLDLSGSDPRRACAETLVAAVPATGAVVGYNAPFEKKCITDLAATFPDLAEKLFHIASRLVDLLPVTRANWYHRDQRGSWSIKAVLPTIAPELDYSGLEVADGGMAQVAYLEATSPETTAERRRAIDAALRAYCARDTEAMIVLARKLVAPKGGA